MERGEVDGLYFASTTSPYTEKGASSRIATATDHRRDVVTIDFAHSLRSGTSALKAALDAVNAGSAKQILVVASDCRLGAPGSSFEQTCGDGAAAFLIGDKDAAVTLEGSYSVCNEIMDSWRVEGDTYIRSWEERFTAEEGYLPTVRETVEGLMKKYNLAPQDFVQVIVDAPDDRRHAQVVRGLKFDPKTQVQDPLFGMVGNTGTAHLVDYRHQYIHTDLSWFFRFLWMDHIQIMPCP